MSIYVAYMFIYVTYMLHICVFRMGRVKRRRDQFADVEDIEAGPSGYTAGRSTKAWQRLHLAVNGCCSHRLYLRACCRMSTSLLPSVFRPCPGMMSFTSVNSTLWTSGGKSAANSQELWKPAIPWGCSWTTLWKLTPSKNPDKVSVLCVLYMFQ